MNETLGAAIATHVPAIDAGRVSDSIIDIYGDTLEIGLFGLDFSVTPSADGTAEIKGTVSNVGDRPVSGIAATVWLTTSEGIYIDWVDLDVGYRTLQPGQSLRASGRYFPSAHPPRLLEERLYLGSYADPVLTLNPGSDVVTRSTLLPFVRLIPSAKVMAVWTDPSGTWTRWFLDLSCEGEPAY